MNKVKIKEVIALCQEINSPESIVRVYKQKMTILHEKHGEVVVSGTNNNMPDYNDERHRGKQGHGFIEWRNADFQTPLEISIVKVIWLNRWTFSPQEGQEIDINMKEKWECSNAIDWVKAIINNEDPFKFRYNG